MYIKSFFCTILDYPRNSVDNCDFTVYCYFPSGQSQLVSRINCSHHLLLPPSSNCDLMNSNYLSPLHMKGKFEYLEFIYFLKFNFFTPFS